MGCRTMRMATIRGACPRCGDLKLRLRRLTVRVRADADSRTYTFDCPRCGDVVASDASPRILALLVTAGVHAEAWHQPAEILDRPGGPPLTADDLLDFDLLL